MQANHRKSQLDVYEYPGTFRVTSVIGHVMSIDFPAEYQSWDKTDPADLFDAPTVKKEANPKVWEIDSSKQLGSCAASYTAAPK